MLREVFLLSGPKLSEAEIERRRQEQLERERQERIRKLQNAQADYQKAKQSVTDLQYLIDSYCAQLGNYAGVFMSTMQSVMQNTSKGDYSVVSTNPQDYYDAINIIQKYVNVVKTTADAQLAANKQFAQKDSNLIAQNNSLQAFQMHSFSGGQSVDISKFDFTCENDKAAFMDDFHALLSHYQYMVKAEKDTDLINFSHNAVLYMRSVYNNNLWNNHIEIGDKLQNIINQEEEIKRLHTVKDGLYNKYYALATILNISPNDRNSFKSVDHLNDAIADLDRKYRKYDEMNFIADQINAVMNDLGYKFVTTTVMQKKDNSKYDFSLYQADDDTGVSVYTSQDGAVMMQTTLLGDDNNITDKDKEFSYQRQLDFCSSHSEIVEALKERGIYLKQVSYCAPDKKYTSKLKVTNRHTTNRITVHADRRNKRIARSPQKMQSM